MGCRNAVRKIRFGLIGANCLKAARGLVADRCRVAACGRVAASGYTN